MRSRDRTDNLFWFFFCFIRKDFCVNNNDSNKRRKSDEWVLLKRSRFDSTQNSMLRFSKTKFVFI